MITADNFDRIEKELNEVFTGAKIKKSIEEAGVKLVFTVSEIGTNQLTDLSCIVEDHELSVKIKRSGTGLSVSLH